MKDLKLIDWMILIALIGVFFSPFCDTLFSLTVTAVLVAGKGVMLILKFYQKKK